MFLYIKYLAIHLSEFTNALTEKPIIGIICGYLAWIAPDIDIENIKAVSEIVKLLGVFAASGVSIITFLGLLVQKISQFKSPKTNNGNKKNRLPG